MIIDAQAHLGHDHVFDEESGEDELLFAAIKPQDTDQVVCL